MSEPGCPNLSEPEMIQKFGQPKPDPNLNSDMTDCPNFNSDKNFVTVSGFFWVGQIQVIGSGRFWPALNVVGIILKS